MPRVLVSDPIAKEGIEILENHFDVDVKIGMSKEELIDVIGDYDALAVRSETKVTAEVLEAAKNLKIIGRAGVGVDNIDVPVATQKGILVVNSPAGNTMAAAELTMALMLSLSRNIPQGHNSLRAGEWKRSKFVGNELYGKTLGVFGLGKIGSAVAKRSQSFEMNVIGYDPFVSEDYARKMGIELVSFEDMLKRCDYFTLHIPATKETKGSIGADQIAMMKTGVRIINVARGGIIDEAALAQAVQDGKVAGIAFDVYEKEPPPADNPLLQLDKAITTPHLGASTEEAQINVSVDVAEQIVEVLNGKPARSAVNMPALSAEVLAAVAPYMVLGERIGAMATQLADGPISAIEISYCGELSTLETGPVGRSVLRGLLQPVMMEAVNLVNAPVIAESRGVRITESKSAAPEDYTTLLAVKVKTDKGDKMIEGTLFGKKDIRIIRLNGYQIDVVPEGALLVASHIDKPGIIGKVGTLLGNEGINIAGMHVGREYIGSVAVMVLNVDDAISEPVLKKVMEIDGIETARLVQFS
ncbi:MAG: phosphoglycerate dehydrogenase [Armatimonadota bacterium]